MNPRDAALEFLAWAQAFEQEWRARPNSFSLSRWHRSANMAIYTRVGATFRATDFQPTIALANIEIDEEHRGQGRWSAVVAALTTPGALSAEMVSVEQVHNDRLAAWLLRNGFERYPLNDFGAPTFRRQLQRPPG